LGLLSALRIEESIHYSLYRSVPVDARSAGLNRFGRAAFP